MRAGEELTLSDPTPTPPPKPGGYLDDQNGNRSSKRLFGLIALLDLSGALFLGMGTGRAPDMTIVMALAGVVITAIGGSAVEFWSAAKGNKP